MLGFFVKIWEVVWVRGISLLVVEVVIVCWGIGREGESSIVGLEVVVGIGWGMSSFGGEWVFFGFEIMWKLKNILIMVNKF